MHNHSQSSTFHYSYNIEIEIKSMINKYLIIDCIKGLKMLSNDSIQCIITSPPYNKLGLRQGCPYNGQIIYDTYDDNMNEIEYQKNGNVNF
ncbi:unnamed protein product [Rotaria sp. Silwood1]|nr:unnamed protein product [Rotaria sp. Silwood1]